MFKGKDENIITVGFFGQSGAGKSTVIKSIPSKIGQNPVMKRLDIIRMLFANNPNRYSNPMEFIKNKEVIMNEPNPGSSIAHMYDKYIKSQRQLMNDFSTEVYETTKLSYPTKTYMFFDRCPLDFYTLTECGLTRIQQEFGGKFNKNHNFDRENIKTTAIMNTDNFFDYVFIIEPWLDKNTNELNDGVRDQYLSDHYTGENWYGKIKGIKTEKTKFFHIDSSINTIDERVRYVTNVLGR